MCYSIMNTPYIFDVLNAVCFVDKIIFGRTNYSEKVSEFKNHKEFYNEKAQQVIEFCKKIILIII